jgi:RNA polymerase sigma-70 factor (ECF subfamily)
VDPSPLTTCTDEELLAALRRGKREAFGVLVRRYEGELFGYLRRYLGDADLADDVFQNTFLQVFTKVRQYEPGRPARPWLYTIATNQAIDALRRSARHQAVSLDVEREEAGSNDLPQLIRFLESRGDTPLDHVQEDERRHLVRAGVERLPEFLRSVVVLAYYQGLKHKEIAEILGIPVGTVKSRMHAALCRLHEAWATQAALKE